MNSQLKHDPNFMFREAELERIISQLNQNQSILLTGIRRTGKTQVVKEALFRFQKSGGQAHYLDVQDYVSLDHFYRDLLNVMPKSVKQKLNDRLTVLGAVPSSLLTWFSSHINKVSAAGISLEIQSQGDTLTRYWKAFADQLATILAEHDTKKLPVIGIDELPFMLENLIQQEVPTNELTVMLASIRKLRDSGLRLIIAGSISMENLLDLHKIPHTVLGGLWREVIPPFTKQEAQQYLTTRLTDTFAQQQPVIDIALAVLPDYVPEFLSISVGYLHNSHTLEQCEQTMRQQVMNHINRAFIHQFNERLAKHYHQDEVQTADQILDTIAKGAPQGIRLNTNELAPNYRQVLTKLQFDNFIMDGDNFTTRFSLNLLRLWWRATRGIS